MQQHTPDAADPSPSSRTQTQQPSAPRPSSFPFLAPAQAPDEVGRLGDFRLLKLLGEGGMGMVFEAEDSRLGRRVAVKVMKPYAARQEEGRRRFLREARAAAAVQHDHVVPIHQVDEDRGTPFLVMPLLKGEALEARLGKQPRLPAAKAARIAREAAEGLAAAHAAGLIHRDVKPSNLWLEETPYGERVKVLDFGLARPLEGEEGLTGTGAFMGTAGYTAPEQARGEAVDGRADLFSLGCVLYRMLTGQAPFRGKTLSAVLLQVETHDPPPPRDADASVPADLSDLVMRLLGKEPAGRPASARETAEALRRIKRSLPPAPVPSPITTTSFAPSPTPHRRKVRAALLVLPALCVVLVLSALLFSPVRAWLFSDLWFRYHPSPPPDPPARTPQTPRDVLVEIAADLRHAPSAERPSWRYLTLAHLHNNPKLSAADLDAFRRTLDEVGRRLNPAGDPASVLRPLGSARLVYAVDLDRLGWDDEGWRRLVKTYPYGLSYRDAEDELKGLDKEIQDLAGGRQRYVRADWFVQAVVNLRADADDGPPVAPGPWPESAQALAQQYPDQTLGLDEAAAELGLSSPSKVLEILKTPPKALEGLVPLREGGSIQRAVWESQEFRSSPYQRLSQTLGLGASSLSD